MLELVPYITSERTMYRSREAVSQLLFVDRLLSFPYDQNSIATCQSILRQPKCYLRAQLTS